MAKTSRIVSLVLALLAAGLLVAGGLTIGFAPTLTLVALVATVVVFYLIVQTSNA